MSLLTQLRDLVATAPVRGEAPRVKSLSMATPYIRSLKFKSLGLPTPTRRTNVSPGGRRV